VCGCVLGVCVDVCCVDMGQMCACVCVCLTHTCTSLCDGAGTFLRPGRHLFVCECAVAYLRLIPPPAMLVSRAPCLGSAFCFYVRGCVVHAYIHAFIYIHAPYIRTLLHSYTHTFIHTRAHTYIRTSYIHAYIHTRIHAYIHAYIHAWARGIKREMDCE